MKPASDPASRLRRQCYGLIGLVAVAIATGNLLSAMRVYEPIQHRPEGAVGDPRSAWPAKRPDPWPTFRSNDRSRWAAIHALVDHGTFAIGRRDRGVVLASAPSALAATDPLQSAVLLEAGYDARIHSDTGLVTQEGFSTVDKILHRERLEYYSSKPPLLTILVAGEYAVLHKLFGWSIIEDRWLVIRFILFTINILPFALYLFLLARLAERFGKTDWGRIFVVAAGAFGTLVTPFLISLNNHTPGAFSVLIALYLTIHLLEAAGRPHLALFALTGLIAGFAVTCELPALAFAVGLGAVLGQRWPRQTLAGFVPAAVLFPAALLWTNYLQLGSTELAYEKVDTDWYQYEGSHWRTIPGQVKRGIDSANEYESRPVYAFHALLGHHGFFSLTPIHFLGLAGMILAWRRYRQLRSDLGLRLAAATLLLSAIVIGFYLYRTHNYGGWSKGFRWLMWLTPLWLLAMLPVVDWLGQRRWGRALGLGLLGLSVLSAHYAPWTPWHHPWIYDWMDAHGWIPY